MLKLHMLSKHPWAKSTTWGSILFFYIFKSSYLKMVLLLTYFCKPKLKSSKTSSLILSNFKKIETKLIRCAILKIND